MMQCPSSGLMLPRQFIDEKQALKKVIDEHVDRTVKELQNIKGTYFLTLHMKFDKYSSNDFKISPPKATRKLPPFLSNSFVFWVSNDKGICELLWMVAPKKNGGKLHIEFNKTGVAYLKAKGAMPS